MVKIIIGVVIAAVVVIAGFLIITPAVQAKTTYDTTLVSTDNTTSVGVEGKVAKEGNYALREGATMADLLEAAGGVLSNSDPRAYYEEATVEAGMTYYIAGLYDYDDICNKETVEKVNVNSDPAETLMQVNGISASVAASIVSYRQENGMFTTIEGLLKVYGIGNATYKKVRDYVILHE